MPDTLYDQLVKVTKHKRQPDEDFAAFAKESVRRVNKLDDAAWKALSDPLQVWVNEAQKAMEAKEEVQALDGFPEEAEAEAETPAEEAPGEATERVRPKGGKKTAPAKKAKAAKPAKAAKGKAKGNGTKGRPSAFDPEATIKLLVKENPHREGSGRYKRWGKYKNGMTVAEAIKAGLNYGNLHHSVEDGHIKIA